MSGINQLQRNGGENSGRRIEPTTDPQFSKHNALPIPEKREHYLPIINLEAWLRRQASRCGKYCSPS
ncbi:hypothetical protein KIN20_037500 [Parelaphostrongylus tenuis]|uniref:Uncharacterized protein n=1 Tax=Parelaphostrongylus tenuis TaxID=148309 RepID=A0AAD5RE14_PARTN|nr:hypothetical protein KIN20_037500 [Parelaphostrongylus tenuis]